MLADLNKFKKISLFSELDEKEMQNILTKIKIKFFKKGDIILHEEETNQYMYIVLSGKVKVLHFTEEGKEIILAIHHEGEFFGEISLIDNKTMPARVVAMDDSEIAIISRRDFFELLSIHKIARRLLEILCNRLRESWMKIELLNMKNIDQRMKILFLMLSNKYGETTERGVEIRMRLTHQDISEMAGISRETVTRILKKWQRNNDISISKQRFICLNKKFYDNIL